MDKYWALGKVWHKTKGAGIWIKFVHQNFQIGVDYSNFNLHVLDQFPPNLDNFLIIAFTIAVFPLMFLIVGMHSNIKVKKINKRAFSTFFHIYMHLLVQMHYIWQLDQGRGCRRINIILWFLAKFERYQ